VQRVQRRVAYLALGSGSQAASASPSSDRAVLHLFGILHPGRIDERSQRLLLLLPSTSTAWHPLDGGGLPRCR
jgi:hypothetical protein